MSRLLGILVAILILSLMLFLHELGHFLMGRKLGFTVVEFSIFMGPRLFSFEKNGIRYSLKAIPLGASVEFSGEYPEENEDYVLKKGDFYERPRWARALTLLAGPLMNILTALIVFIILFSVTGFAKTRIADIDSGSLAQDAGMKAGEQILSIDGYKVRTDLDFGIGQMVLDPAQAKEAGSNYIILTQDPQTGEEKSYEIKPRMEDSYVFGIVMDFSDNKNIISTIDKEINPNAGAFVPGDEILKVDGKEVNPTNLIPTLRASSSDSERTFTINRGGKTKDIQVKPSAVPGPVPLGVSLTLVQKPGFSVVPYTFQYMWSYLKGTGKVLGQVFRGRARAQDTLTGPVGIVSVFSGVVTSEFNVGLKLIQIFNLFAVISLALGATNLLPIPPLDGGQLLLLIIESIRRKRLSLKAQNIVTMIGVVFVLGLAALALGFDILRIFKK
jgi:regulator of sigma E protease